MAVIQQSQGDPDQRLKPGVITDKQERGDSRREQVKSKDYSSEGVTDNDVFLLPGSDFQLLGFLTLIATLVRLYRIYQPSSVVFDEVHFGGFASKYIKGRFFMDVHPPLAKLLITLFGWLAGYDGKFDFKEIGKDYLEPNVPYVAMRMLPAILGIATIPTMFLTLKAVGCKTTTAAMGSALLIFENALVTQSRLILLDSPLVFCTALTALAFTCFTNQHELGPSRAFDATWWFWLVATGVGLGLTVSVKWVGLFTIAWVGSLTLVQLWVLLGDTNSITPRKWFKHLFARFFCLVVIPVTVYLSLFAIHFVCLVNPGDGDGFMSSEFQSTLNSKAMQDVPANVAFGSQVSIRHQNTQGGYLHSHNHMYPGGSKQQQITLYPHKDENNMWLLENKTQPVTADNVTIAGPRAWDNQSTTWIENGDMIRLYHINTDRRLHSHDVRPPVTEAEWQNEVTAYGYEGFEGDANDLFRVEIINPLSENDEARKRLRTIQTKFKLVHVMTGCVLFSHKVKLPEWGFEQQEVTCAKGGTLPNSVWYIEQNRHPMLGNDTEKVNYRKPGFLGKFWELQRVMWKTNAGLVDSHAWDSRPASWPTLRRGINFWGRNHRQVYLLGNPAIWYASTLAVAVYVLFKGLSILRWQRGFKDHQNINFKRFDYELGSTVLAWTFHYFPFFLMSRQLFLHHYLPALYFAIMALSQIYDFAAHRVSTFGLRHRPEIGGALAVLFLAFAIGTFTMYAPLTYGNAWTKDSCRAVKLFNSWDFDCNTFYANYSQYDMEPKVSGGAQTSPPSAASNNRNAPKVAAGEAKLGSEDEAKVTPVQAKESELKLLNKQEKVEYRDSDGNILDPALVSAMADEGKVTFQTRRETKIRKVDAEGNEVVELVQDEPDGEDDRTKTEYEIKTETKLVDPQGNPVKEVQGEDGVEVSTETSTKYVDAAGNPIPDSEADIAENDRHVVVHTKIKYVDEAGNELPSGDGSAPDHPDMEGQNPDTGGPSEDDKLTPPVNAAAGADESARDEDVGRPSPAGDASEATS